MCCFVFCNIMKGLNFTLLQVRYCVSPLASLFLLLPPSLTSQLSCSLSPISLFFTYFFTNIYHIRGVIFFRQSYGSQTTCQQNKQKILTSHLVPLSNSTGALIYLFYCMNRHKEEEERESGKNKGEREMYLWSNNER